MRPRTPSAEGKGLDERARAQEHDREIASSSDLRRGAALETARFVRLDEVYLNSPSAPIRIPMECARPLQVKHITG